MTIVVYSSHTGSTRKYAEIFASRNGFSCYSIKDDYNPDEMIIYFGWLNGPRIDGLSSVNKLRLIAVVSVSLSDPPSFGWNKVKDTNGIVVPFYHLLGWIDRSKLHIHEKLFFYVLCAIMKLRGLDNHTKPLFDAMMEGGSFFDEKGLDQIQILCN